VTLAEGSQKALELLASAATFDLVVLDVNMPGIDGREVHRKVRRVFPDLPILMYSGLIDSDLISVVENSPHTLLISKPAKFEVLMDSMTRLLAGA
jgi:CheY-like chemotaxis protein